jgi:membrane-bound lytic murein transglycosylase D
MKKHLITIVFLVLTLVYNSALAADRINKSADSTLVYIPDDPILAMMDSLMSQKYFESKNFITDTCKLNKNGYCPEVIPTFDAVVYQERIALLDSKSPFNLIYSDAVKAYIDLYAVRKRNIVSRMIGLSQVYFPLFEEKLDKYKLPDELKYLAIVESALNPNAISKSGAAGLWQFMYGTGKMFGLDVNSYVDERRDPYKATEAACKYFKFLYNIFGDWQMVLAAYNGGPGTVNKAIRRSGGKKTYWEIRPFLPLETQGYVPAFIAVNYVMNYTSEHNLYPISPKQVYLHTDTVATRQYVSFNQISAVLNLPIEDISYLNPQYKLKIIPYSGEQAMLCLPVAKVGAFINNENSIYTYKTPEERLDSALTNTNKILVEEKKWHKVRSGESLKQIANLYSCTIRDIKDWNNLKGNKVAKGKRLIVYTKKYKSVETKSETTVADTATKNLAQNKVENSTTSQNTDSVQAPKETTTVSASAPKSKTKFVYYTVQRGDTLWNIANRKGVSVEEIKRLNNIRSSNSLKAGSKIKIAVAS